MERMELNPIIDEISRRIKIHFAVQTIYLFGSAVTGSHTEDSDIDILIILNEPGKSGSFMELVNRRNKISRLLLDIKKKIPLDILVYTNEEWQILIKDGSSFTREILEKGLLVA
jgi:predicted nucleotidyltransferase